MKIPDKLEFDTIIPEAKASKAIISLHGWQGNRSSFQQVCRSMNITDAQWFFPEAPYLAKEDDRQRSWSIENSPGVWEMDKPRQLLDDFFSNHIWPAYSPCDVYVMGFSQGALVCFEFILQMNKPLGGVFPIAGFLRDPDAERPRIHPSQKQTPILIGHGRDDDIVPLSASQRAYDALKNQGANVRLLVYKGKHKIGLTFLNEMKKILKNGSWEL